MSEERPSGTVDLADIGRTLERRRIIAVNLTALASGFAFAVLVPKLWCRHDGVAEIGG
jgi:hypothetical protein